MLDKKSSKFKDHKSDEQSFSVIMYLVLSASSLIIEFGRIVGLRSRHVFFNQPRQ